MELYRNGEVVIAAEEVLFTSTQIYEFELPAFYPRDILHIHISRKDFNMQVSHLIKGFVFIAGLSCINSAVMAEGLKSSITAGYAHTTFHAQSDETFDYFDIDGKLQGFNTKGRFEFDDTWGLVSSYAHTQKSYDYINIYYNSLTIGPSVRLNDYVSLYALIGSAWGEAETYNDSSKKTSLAGGNGIQFNPIPNLILDASYEYSKLGDFKVDTWVAGAGVRF